MSTTTKINYAKETKELIKDGINRLGGDLTNLSTFRSYASVLNAIYNALPKVSGEGSNISLSPTLKGGLDITPKGACEQDSYSGKNLVKSFYYKGASTLNFYIDEKHIVSSMIMSGITDVSVNNMTIYIKFGSTTYTITSFNMIANEKFSVTLNLTNEQLTAIQEAENVYIQLYRPSQSSVDLSTCTYSEIMLRDSSTTDTYEPYVGGIPSPNPNYPQDVRVVTGDNDVVVQNKNLFDGWTKGYVLNDVTGVELIRSDSGISDYIPVNFTTNPNYVLSGLTNTLNSLVWAYNSSKQGLGRTTGGVRTTINLTSSSFSSGKPQGTGDIAYIRITQFKTTGNTGTGDDIDNLQTQLEIGSTATTYVPHSEQVKTLHLGSNYLAGIGNYKDEIVGKTDDWKIKRKVKKVIANDYTWSFNGTYLQANTTVISDIIASQLTESYCNVGIIKPSTASGSNLYYISSDKRIVFRNPTYNGTPITTQADFNSYIKANAIFYIKLEESIEIPITDTTLISDLNNMYNLMGYDGQTNITITSNSSNAQMTAQVKALKGE